MTDHKHRDLYRILEVDSQATTEEIRSAFIKKALKWHPDKAPTGATEKETSEIKEIYNKKYTDLQLAYKILFDPETRKQYNETLQSSHQDLRQANRDHSYHHTNKYKVIDEASGRVKFDEASFSSDFNRTRGGADAEEYHKMMKKATTGKIAGHEVNSYLSQRNDDLESIKEHQTAIHQKLVAGGKFDANAFNRLFDHTRKQAPLAGGVQEYTGDPGGLFSSTGLAEQPDVLGGVTLNHGVDFGGGNTMNALVGGVADAPATSIDISQFKADQPYYQEGKLSASELEMRLKQAQEDRERLKNLDQKDFVVTKTEIETQYAGLFDQNTAAIEGLTARKN